jgi:hypothetical protein
MQSRRIAPPIDLRGGLEADDIADAKRASTQTLSLRPAPQTKAPKLLDKKLVLKRIYRQFPTLRLNQLVAKAVLENPKLRLREAEDYFKLRREKDRVKKESDPKRRKTRKDKQTVRTRIEGLTSEQKKALDYHFFTTHKGVLAQRAFWETFNRENERQKKSLEDTGRAWISWRDIRAYVGAQETSQIHQRANKQSRTLVNLPTEEQLIPFTRFQIDYIEMAAGNNRRNDDNEAWRPGQKLTSEKDSRGLPDSGKRKILHMVDLYSNYSFLYGSAKVDQDSAIAGTKAFIDAIRERYGNGEWPNDGAVIASDMGKE